MIDDEDFGAKSNSKTQSKYKADKADMVKPGEITLDILHVRQPAVHINCAIEEVNVIDIRDSGNWKPYIDLQRYEKK